MKKHIYISAFVLFLLPGIASALNLDSLWGVWNDKTQPDTNRLEAMHEIARDVKSFSHPESAFYFARLELELAKKLGNKMAIAESYNNIGNVYYNQGNYKQALLYHEKSLKIKEETGNKKGKATSYSNMGQIYSDQGQTKMALQFTELSLRIREQIGDSMGIATSLTSLGMIYRLQGNRERAMDYYKRSLQIRENIDEDIMVGLALNDIASLYKDIGDFELAMDYCNQSLKIFKERGIQKEMANSLRIIGTIYYIQNKYEKALAYYQKGLEISEKINNKKSKAYLLSNISNVYFNQGMFDNAISLGKRSLSLAQELGVITEIKSAALSLYKSYVSLGQNQNALEMYELHIQMRDSLNNSDVRQAVDQFEQKMEHDKEMLVLEQEQERKAALAAEEKQTREQRTYAIAGVGVLALVLSVLIYNRYRHTRRQRKVIGEQKKLVEEHTLELTASIRYARNIQKAVVPTNEELSVLPEHFVLFQPKDIISGDFYWMAEKEGRVYFAACDCTGHGVPGAFMSMLIKALLDEAVNQKGLTKPNEIFYEVRKDVIDALKQSGAVGTQKDGMDAVLCAWNRNGTLEYALANNPLVLIRDGELHQTKADKQPVGILTGEQIPFTHHELQLQKGDTIYLFSDGYPDQFGGPKDKKFKLKNMKTILLQNKHKPLSAQKDILQKTMDEWMGDTEQVDDILVMGVRF